MAATYDPSQASATDRVRRMIDDRKAPFRFQNEEIQAVIDGYGSGVAAEIQAGIELLDSETSGSSSSVSMKQGTWSRTTTASNFNESRIKALRDRLAKFYLDSAAQPFSGVGAADAEFPYPQDLPNLTASCRPISPTE